MEGTYGNHAFGRLHGYALLGADEEQIMRFSESISVLYVDDDELDLKSMQRSFKKNGIKNPLYIARNGLEALDMLSGPGAISPRPSIVLLDINMPMLDGLETVPRTPTGSHPPLRVHARWPACEWPCRARPPPRERHPGRTRCMLSRRE